MKALQLLAIGLCCIAAPLAAQDTTHARHPMQRAPAGEDMMEHMMPMMREMMGPMMRAMSYAPDHLLSRRDSLHLTGDQVTRLTAIRDGAKTAHDAAAADVKLHFDELAQAFQSPSPDTSALLPHFQAAHAAMGKAHWAMLAASARAKAVLTDAQRTQVDAWVMAMERREHTM